MKIKMLVGATYQPYGECADCEWQTAASSMARDKAKRHARAEGHRVRIVVETVRLWGPS